ncbi:MAG TPA: undecaprenyl-diphosphatase [Firmicutes bacterium]|nr:undecaprenyl-diphosphatase [Bacillota bacterium]
MIYFFLVLFALFFGVIEGISEWLLISSTGHMILFDEVLRLCHFDLDKELGFVHGETFMSLFLVVVQFGAILAVVIYFFKKLWPFTPLPKGEDGLALPLEEAKAIQKKNNKTIWIRWGKTLLGILPAAVIGLIFELLDWEDQLSNWICVGLTLIVYGVLFLIMEFLIAKGKFTSKYKSIDDLPWKTAFLIGCFQVLALLPGTSRSGVTILGALLLLTNRETAAEYSFYLSIPVMAGASLLKTVRYFAKIGSLCLNEWIFLGVGTLVSFGVSLLVVRWLMSFLKKHTFKGFGYYRIALGVVVLLVFGISSCV